MVPWFMMLWHLYGCIIKHMCNSQLKQSIAFQLNFQFHENTVYFHPSPGSFSTSYYTWTSISKDMECFTLLTLHPFNHRAHVGSDNSKYSTSVCLKNPTGIPKRKANHRLTTFQLWLSCYLHAVNKVHETTIPNSTAFLLAFISERL